MILAEQRAAAKENNQKTFLAFKACNKCGEHERYTSNGVCVNCQRSRMLNTYHTNKEYKQNQLERQAQPEYREKQEAYYNEKYSSSRGLSIHSNLRIHWERATKWNAIPEGTDKEALNNYMVFLFQICEMLENNTGIRYSVDHIVPMSKGGLHCVSNLQILTLSENCSKSDKLPKNLPKVVSLEVMKRYFEDKGK